MTKLPRWVYSLPWQSLHAAAEKYKLPPALVACVVYIESAGNTFACRFEPRYRYTFEVRTLADLVGCTVQTMETMQKTSYGLMQVMGGVFYEHGGHKNKSHRWATSMCDVKIGLEYGCKHLSQKFVAYGPDPARTYAAYNAGSIRKTKGGLFVNEVNVDRFMRLYRQLTQEKKSDGE